MWKLYAEATPPDLIPPVSPSPMRAGVVDKVRVRVLGIALVVLQKDCLIIVYDLVGLIGAESCGN